MGEVVLTVPAEHREAFTQAAMIEVENCGDWVKDTTESLVSSLRKHRDFNCEDVTGAVASLSRDVAVLRILDRAPEGGVEVRSEAPTLAHICESMAGKVLPVNVEKATEISPLDGSEAEQALALVATLQWAVTNAAELHASRNGAN